MSSLSETRYTSQVEILQERRSFSNLSYNKSVNKSNNAVVISNMDNDELVNENNLTQDIIQSLSILNQYSKCFIKNKKINKSSKNENDDKLHHEPNFLQKQYSENFWENYEQYCMLLNVAPIQSIKTCVNADGIVNLALKADKLK